jgi:hypothetical protein
MSITKVSEDSSTLLEIKQILLNNRWTKEEITGKIRVILNLIIIKIQSTKISSGSYRGHWDKIHSFEIFVLEKKKLKSLIIPF